MYLGEIEGFKRLYREIFGVDYHQVKEEEKMSKLVRELGNKTDKTFLNSIIPDFFIETVYENDTHWASQVKGFRLNDDGWADLVKKIKNEFGDNLIEVYSISGNGVRFVVYLKKSKL